MSEAESQSEADSHIQSEADSRMFSGQAPRPERSGMPMVAWAAAAFAILAAVAVLALAGRHGGGAARGVLPLDAYAGNLAISKIEMSESTSLSGGKSTYIDGLVKNTGTKTVTGATVQVLFANDSAMPPQVETTPLMPIRTREPYVDTQMLSANPLKPGQEREFRLIFEGIAENWNQTLPEIHVVKVEAR
jgi:hypothetical protein